MTVATTDRDVRWERLHPLSPIVRSGRAAIVLVAFLGLNSARQQNGTQTRIYVDIGLVILAAGLAVVNWLVTRWVFDGRTLRFETGLFRRDTRQIPVTRIQAVDIVRPLLARFFGLAELTITMAGGGKQTRLAYLSDGRADALRSALLAAHHGQDPATPEPAEVAALAVPTDRLLGSVFLSAPAVILILLIAALVVVGLESPKGLPGVLATLVTYLAIVGAAVWRRFNLYYGFTVAYAPDGIRVRRGLLGTVAETIPVRRIQAVRQIEPLLWRALGWCRLEVDLARVPGREGTGDSRRMRKTLLPVGSLQMAEALRSAVIGSVAFTPARPPPRARFKSPLSYHFLRAGHDDTIAVAVTGRVCRRSAWIPLEKLQSVRRVQGPVQRWLGLATVHVDVAGREVEAEFRDRDGVETTQLVENLAVLSRVARTRSLPDPQPGLHPSAYVSGSSALQAPMPSSPQQSSPPAASPGWYADPSGRHRHRYWDGSDWTAHVHDADQKTAVDPM